VNTNIEIISVVIFRKYKEKEFLIQQVSNMVADFYTSKSFLI